MRTKSTLEDFNFFINYNEFCGSCGEGGCIGSARNLKDSNLTSIFADSPVGPFVVIINYEKSSKTYEFQTESDCVIFLKKIDFECS